MALDLDAARRQTLAKPRPPAVVDELLAGTLTMSPHPSWTLPEQPTWLEDPFQDRNWCFQYQMLRWLNPLLWAAETGNDAAWRMWLHWVDSWVDTNLDGSTGSEWAWRDMSDGIRAAMLCSAAPLMAERAPERMEWLEHVIRVHADHLRDPENIGGANHALHQHDSLFVVGRVLGDPQLWQLARHRMGVLIHEQYDEQGMNAEGAVAYHHNNYLWWERAMKRFDLEGIERPDGADRHVKAPIGLAHATRPTGTYVPIGDTDASTLPKRLKIPFSQYVDSNGISGALPDGMSRDETVKIYDAGYVFGRSGWGDAQRPFSEHTHYSVRFGPSQRVHGHPDGGAITYTGSGVDWVVDPGKFDYSNSPMRQHLASRASHSLVTLEGVRPRKNVDVRLTRRIIAPDHHDFTFQDNTFARAKLRRRIVYSVTGEYLVVIDEASSLRALSAAQRWQIGPDVRAMVTLNDSSRVVLSLGNKRATITSLNTTPEIDIFSGADDSCDGQVSLQWKETSAAPVATMRQRGKQVCLATVLAAGYRRPPLVSPNPESRPGHWDFSILTGRASERCRIQPDHVSITEEDPAQSSLSR